MSASALRLPGQYHLISKLTSASSTHRKPVAFSFADVRMYVNGLLSVKTVKFWRVVKIIANMVGDRPFQSQELKFACMELVKVLEIHKQLLSLLHPDSGTEPPQTIFACISVEGE